MTEFLLKDQLELNKRQADRADWEKVSNLQEAHSVLRTRFEAQLRRYEEATGRAVSQEDLRMLRIELEDRIKHEVVQMHIEIEKSNQAWAEKILSGARALNAESQIQRMEEQKRFSRQIGMTVLAAVLSILGALFVFWETSRLH